MCGQWPRWFSVRTSSLNDVASTRWSFPQAPLELRVCFESDPVRIIVAGELDLATSAALDEQLFELEEVGFDHIVVDLRGVSFVDCAGLRIVLDASRRARAARTRFEVIGGGKVCRLLALTGAELPVASAMPISGASLRRGLEVAA